MSLGDNFGDNLGITRYPLHYLQGGTALFAGGTASLAGGAAYFAGGAAYFAVYKKIIVTIVILPSMWYTQKDIKITPSFKKGEGIMAGDTQVDRRVLYDNRLNCSEKLVLLAIMDVNEISYSDLAEKIGITKKTAITAVKRLKSKGLLEYEPKSGRSANQYHVII